MIETNILKTIDFKPVSVEDKQIYNDYFWKESDRGCEVSFANLFLWGEQNIFVGNDYILLLSKFGEHRVYPYPLGESDKKPLIDRIIADSKQRGIPCYISGVTHSSKKLLEELYPDKFRFDFREGSFDYVYDINDLADLPGKKYHAKRTHINRFKEDFPDYSVESITEENASLVLEMAEIWFAARILENTEADYKMEKTALKRALSNYRALGLEGIILRAGGRILAFSMASRMTEDTFDVHFKKAVPDARGAYAIINCEFARYIRNKYPSVKFLDREEDMGLEGLRKAKRSYHPHHQIEKWRAFLLEESK